MRPENLSAEAMAERSIRLACQQFVARRLDLTVAGREHLPAAGPALIAARHVHHLYDGCALIATLPRPVHLLVALDWLRTPWGRRLMAWACRTARWPVVLRAEAFGPGAAPSAFRADETGRYLRRAVAEAVDLLRAGQVLVVFPEAYPAVDPGFTPKLDLAARLPFRPGFARLAGLAQRDGYTRVPIIPAGFDYEAGPRWRVQLGFGAPVFWTGRADEASLVQAVEEQARRLSTPVPDGPRASMQEEAPW